MREAAYRAFELREEGIPVASLVYDSLVDEPAGVDAGARYVKFEADGRLVQVTVQAHGETAELGIALTPPRAVDVVVKQVVKGVTALRTDSNGIGHGEAQAGDLTTLLVTWADDDGGVLRTGWLRI